MSGSLPLVSSGRFPFGELCFCQAPGWQQLDQDAQHSLGSWGNGFGRTCLCCLPSRHRESALVVSFKHIPFKQTGKKINLKQKSTVHVKCLNGNEQCLIFILWLCKEKKLDRKTNTVVNGGLTVRCRACSRASCSMKLELFEFSFGNIAFSSKYGFGISNMLKMVTTGSCRAAWAFACHKSCIEAAEVKLITPPGCYESVLLLMSSSWRWKEPPSTLDINHVISHSQIICEIWIWILSSWFARSTISMKMCKRFFPTLSWGNVNIYSKAIIMNLSSSAQWLINKTKTKSLQISNCRPLNIRCTSLERPHVVDWKGSH